MPVSFCRLRQRVLCAVGANDGGDRCCHHDRNGNNGNGQNGYGNNDYGNGGFSDPFGLW